MSWSIASLLILAVVLGVGFAWYERSRPSPKVVALVATLAALAALGRVAFAPIPNVKPTTDIVLIAGLALGGAPGFMVGAVAAVSSNVFFGQGTWTPWQMLAWGGVGLFGAGLGHVLRGRIGRVGLAAACGAAGLAFGVVMNLSIWVTFTGSHTLGEFLALSGAAVPFDLAHAFGNVVFALAFGPALLRALLRFRARFEVRWVSAPGAPPSAGPEPSVAPSPARAATGAGYLERAQNPDGGFGGAPGQSSTALHTGWATLGLAAAGRNPLDVRRAGRTPLDAMRRGVATLADAGELERTILALGAAGLSPRSFGGRDLVAALLRRRRSDGSFDGLVNLTSFGVLALRAAGLPSSAPSVGTAIRFILRRQNPDGGWSFAGRGGPSGLDDTSAPLQAIVSAGGRGSNAVRRAVTYLRARQNPDGGFPLSAGGASNAQSTAWVAQALVAAGRDPDAVRSDGSRSPLGYLRSLMAADGSVRYSRASVQTPVWVTAQALTALARRPFPIPRVPRRRLPERAAAADRQAASDTAPTTAAATPAAAPVQAKPRPAAARPPPAGDPQVLSLARTAGAAVGLLMASIA